MLYEEDKEPELLTMGLREREKKIDELEKENFGLKMRLHYFQDINSASPDQIKSIMNEVIFNLKVH